MIRRPGLLSPDLVEVARLDPSAGTLTLKMVGASEATLTLSEDAPALRIHDWISIYSRRGFCGVFRISNIVQTYRRQLDVTLLHGIDILADSYWAEEREYTGSVRGYLEALLQQLGVQPGDPTLAQKADSADLRSLAEELAVGEPTLRDILRELAKPGRDPRDELPPPLLREDVLDMKDLKEGMTLQGTVRNVIDFGAFVDIGVHQDGLVHVSQISNKFIKHPSEVLKVGDVVTVQVLGVDLKKKRISLTMKGIKKA